MKLIVAPLAIEDTWKNIVRINEDFRNNIPRASICRIRANSRSAWIILHGRSNADPTIQMDLNTRLLLKVSEGEKWEFTLEKLSWIQSLWFPWKASDPMYRLPAQLSIVSFFVGTILGVLGVLLALK